MAHSTRSSDDDRARRTTLKRTVLRLGVPVAFLVAVGGAAPAGAVSPAACPGLSTAALGGGEGAPFETICPDDIDPAFAKVKVKYDQ